MPGGSPITRPSEFLFTCLFVRGDVKTSAHRVELQVPQSILGEFKQASTEQTKLGLMSGFAISFPDLQPPEGVVQPAEPDMIVTPAGGVRIRQNDNWTDEVDRCRCREGRPFARCPGRPNEAQRASSGGEHQRAFKGSISERYW